MASMAVTLEVSKLSGWLKAVADCRVEGRACDAGGERCEPGGGRACVVWWRHDKRHARGPTQGLGAKGTRGAHAEHVAHVRDAGGVKAQRLVEGRRALPSRGEGMRCGGRGARRKAGGPVGWWRHTRGMLHGARLKAWGPRARAERTLNMSRMSVTLEVSKLSGWLKFDARCRVEGRACDAGGREVGAGWREGLWCGGGTTSGMHGEKARLKAWGPRARAGSAPRTCGTCQ
jgi:hypothetical protein